MKAVIFCGGFATRFNNGKPGPLKPLIKVNKISILERIIRVYLSKSVKEFILLGGYKYFTLNNFSKKLKNKLNISIDVINTGKNTPTGGRLLKVKNFLKDSNFYLTYGDSLANFNPVKALSLKNKKNFIISTYKYRLEYGVLSFKKDAIVNKIYEKNYFTHINAGYYIFDYSIFNYIKSYNDSLEKDVLPRILNSTKKIKIYKVTRWSPMDNPNDKSIINNILSKNKNFFRNEY